MLFTLLKIYLLSAQFALLSFGGMFAFWAHLDREVVLECNQGAEHKSDLYICHDDFEQVLALSKAVPGPQINMAAILGYQIHGVAGMLAFLCGLLTPVAIVLPLMLYSNKKFGLAGTLNQFFRGMSVGIIAILLFFLSRLLLGAFSTGGGATTVTAAVLFVSVFTLSYTQRLHPMLAVTSGALVGFFFL